MRVDAVMALTPMVRPDGTVGPAPGAGTFATPGTRAGCGAVAQSVRAADS